MSTTGRVFVARLVGLAVFGPDGEQIGKVRDVVAALRIGRQPPRVLGLVVELLTTRRRIFVPILQVTALNGGAITLSTGRVSLRRFAQRANEVLVVGQILEEHVRLLDRGGKDGGTPATVVDGGTPATVVDAGMKQTRTRDWVIDRVAVRARTGRLGRRGPVEVLEWDAVGGLSLAEHGQGAPELVASFEGMRATDVANALRELPIMRRYEVADALDDERLADVLEELPENDQRVLLAHLPAERAADVLEAMSPDDAADLLAELPELEKNRLLELMEPKESGPVRRLLAYSSDTAGGLMTSEPVVLSPAATVAEALARLRNPDLTPALASIAFVCRAPQATPTGRYLGCAHLQRLLREPPSELVAGALDTELPTLEPQTSLAAVTRYFASYNLVCGPVLDAEEHLLGAVTVDDVLDHLLPDGWRETEHDDHGGPPTDPRPGPLIDPAEEAAPPGERHA